MSEEYGTPAFATLVTMAIALPISIFLNFEILADMISVGTLLAFIVVCGGVIVCRYDTSAGPFGEGRLSYLCLGFVVASLGTGFCIEYAAPALLAVPVYLITFITFCVILYVPSRQPECATPGFKCPLCPCVPAFGMFGNAFLIASMQYESFVRVVIWTLTGLIIYFSYGLKYSTLNRECRRMTEQVAYESAGHGAFEGDEFEKISDLDNDTSLENKEPEIMCSA